MNFSPDNQYSVFNLGNFKGGHFHLISDENYFPIHIMLKMAKSSFSIGSLS